jgi:argininosuccinate lyase
MASKRAARKTTRKAKAKRPADKAWSGRFTRRSDPRADAYSFSLDVDIRLLPFDVVGGQAHAEMLARCGIISREEERCIQAGLKRILGEWEHGRVEPKTQDEDVHMLVERRLGELIGPVAGKLHTARSRNDQVVTDLKLYLREEIPELITGLRQTQRALWRLARKHADWVMPGYTHVQVAQPVLAGHWLLAHLEAFARDEARFSVLLKGSLDELPLGAAALAGTSHPIDRRLVARLLGFSRVTGNSMDTVADRDFALEFLAAGALCGLHASRLAEELVWFSGSEFGFLTVSQGFATGSSIMPQKRNPDIAELLRGRAGRLAGDWVTLFTVLKGLPLTYNRDLQEDKPPVFNAMDTLQGALGVLPPMLDTLTLHRDRLRQACDSGFPTATEAADHLVRRGVPFRQAHAAVGRAVTHAAERGQALTDLDLADWRRFHPAFQVGVCTEISPERSVLRKRSLGGTAPGQVRAALARWRRVLFPGRSK